MQQVLHQDVHATAEDIASMEVRGPGQVAAAGARALRVQAEESDAATAAAFRAEQRATARRLLETRPTAGSLPNALRYVLTRMTGEDVPRLRASVVDAAREFTGRLDRAAADVGRIGAGRIRDGNSVLLHAHSPDAIACVEVAARQNKDVEAVVTETRPRESGHATARELRDLGVPVTLIVDSAARRSLEAVDLVLLGADAVAADGSVVGEIGTAGLGVNARDRVVPVVVAAQTIRLHPRTLTGHEVEIDSREARSVLSDAEREKIGDVAIENPAWDVTPPDAVDAIVTERGQFTPESVVTLMRELYGERPGEPWTEEALD